MSHPVDIHAGRQLRKLRIAKGVTQESLGEAVGVTFQQIQKYEKGANRLSASRLAELAEYLGAPIEYFFQDMSTPEDSADKSLAVMRDVLMTSDGQRLATSYMALRNDTLRKHLVQLVEAMASPD